MLQPLHAAAKATALPDTARRLLAGAVATASAASPAVPFAVPPLPPRLPPQAGMLAKLFDPLVAMMAPRYQAAVGKELIKYGLRYEDLYDPQLDLVSGGQLGVRW